MLKLEKFDLFSTDIWCHQSCKKSVLDASIHWRSTNLSAKEEQCRKEQSHDAAFNVIYDIVESDVVNELKIVRLDSLCKIYIEELEKWGEPN